MRRAILVFMVNRKCYNVVDIHSTPYKHEAALYYKYIYTYTYLKAHIYILASDVSPRSMARS